MDLTMKVELDKYEIVSKILLGASLKVIFKNVVDATDRKVLELKDVVGFIDSTDTKQPIKTLRLDEQGGSYNLDLSLRLQRQEIKVFPEVFIFIDTACVDFCFRSVAKSIEFRDWVEKDKWLP
jgi:hypothetical protein